MDQIHLHQAMLSQHQQQLQDPSSPQDVLAEARKNLQVLIDSGLSKDILHQWVDDSQSLQLNLTAQSLASHFQVPHHHQPPPVPQPQQLQQQSPELHHSQSPSITLPIPPVPTCPPPPPPTLASQANMASPTLPSTPSDKVKPETILEDTAAAWPPTSTISPPPTTIAPTAPRSLLPSVVETDPSAIFMAPQPPFSHKPRISVSSTSSGSSGHASIWSNNSAQSSMSWQSASTCPPHMHAPLPMPPGLPSPNGAPLVNGAMGMSAAGKTNIYWCTSCETSFKRKYDWKRHEDEFHERWRKYPCPEPGCNRSFWGSNSFNQHHKQCHGCKTCPHADKVVKFLRKRKYWACGFCSALHPARERHVEHVARHFESGLTKSDWMHSRVVYGLLHQPLIHEAWDALVVSKQPEYAGRRPQFSWHPSKTGRAQGFLEKENPGQLQDLLEFFSGDDGEAQWIVSVAYDLADIVLTAAPLQAAQFPDGSMAPPQVFPGPDPRMSFMTMPPQAPQQSMMPSSDPSNPFGAPFRNTMFLPSQPFPPTQQPSPDSSSQSPMTTQSQSPMTASQSPLDKRELPPPPSNTTSETGSGMMEFEYSPAPIVFEDWESLNSAMVDDGSSHSTNPGAQPDWGMVPYFAGPRVPSS